MIHRLPPKSVAIVAMGQSSDTYLRLCANLGDRRRVADETWAINAMGGVIQHDLLFHMDDCKVQEARAARTPDSNIAGMVRWLRDHPNFITSKAYPEYPGAHEFPLQDVINTLGASYFNNTVPYAMAYALFIGVKKVAIYGADYSYENLHKAEMGRGCLEFWIGLAAARGVAVEVAGNSTLLDANVDASQRFYGYDASDVTLEQTDAGVRVIQTPRESLPSAEEIEVRYNHEPQKESA